MPRKKPTNTDEPSATGRMRLTSSPLAALGQRAGFATAAERAAATGLSRSHILHLERGAVRPSMEAIRAMSEAYHQPEAKIERASELCRESLAHRMLAQSRAAV